MLNTNLNGIREFKRTAYLHKIQTLKVKGWHSNNASKYSKQKH